MSKPYRLMIDPGHGGRDPGAISRDGAYKEKDITLEVALDMRRTVLKGDYLYELEMTRTNDYYVSLPERCIKANNKSFDAFMSIHCNARERRGKQGLELEIFHYKGSEKGEELATIALNFLIRDLDDSIPCINRGVKTANFYVLKHTNMAAVLVELGFMTDPEEAEFLRNHINQRKMARALAEAVEIYFEGGSHEWRI